MTDGDSRERETQRALVAAMRVQAEAALRRTMPAAIGDYKILGELGRGGMGVVYRAEQPGTDRVVALKILRTEFASALHRRRFRNEAVYLGRLDHPGIARIIEVGVAEGPTGHVPFIAMEFVEGARPVTDYVEREDLDVRARLDLIAEIADAVQHAHLNGIVHRDLKPANIVVDREGRVRVLDFGVARVTDHDIQATTVETEVGRMIGSLPYMSPEQASGDVAAVDMRSDVYSLGVVAYELLCGRPPYRLERRAVHEAVRVIRDELPTRLGSARRAFRGDVETIVGKTLEKAPSRRYQSVAEFAADIRRHLADEPIHARRATLAYQVVKFARRHSVAAAVAALALSASLVAAGAAVLGAIDRAEVARLADLHTRGEAALLAQRFDVAEALLGECFERRLQILGPDHVDTLATMEAVGELRYKTDEHHAAVDVLSEFVERRHAAGGEDDDDAIRSQLRWGEALLKIGDASAAGPVLDEALARLERKHLGGLRSHVVMQQNLAIRYGLADDYETAIDYALLAYERAECVFGPTHDETLAAADLIGALYFNDGQADRAKPWFDIASGAN